MNPEGLKLPEETLLGSIESATQFHFPDFFPDRSRLNQPTSAGTRILEFHTPEGAGASDPIIYLSIQADPTTCTAYAQNVPVPEGKIGISGLPSHDFGSEGTGVFWDPLDIHMMLSKLKVFMEGIELSNEFLDQLGTWSPKLQRFLTIRERLLSATELKSVETEPDSIEEVDWNQADEERRAIYEEEQRLILEQKYTQTLNGLTIQTLATKHPRMAQLLAEQSIQRRGAIVSPLGEVVSAEVALSEIRAGSQVGTQLVRMELHRLDAYEQILKNRKPTVSSQQSSVSNA